MTARLLIMAEPHADNWTAINSGTPMPERVQLMDDDALDRLAKSVAAALRGDATGTNWDRLLTYVIGALTIISLIFTFGVNWSRINATERRLDVIEHRMDVSEFQ